MKKTGILNKDISQVVASLGHNDTLVIADAGLPIPFILAVLLDLYTKGRK